MNKYNILLAQNTLTYLEKNSWNKITIDKVIPKGKKININKKIDLLININRYFDFKLKQNISSLENSSSKDMLFEVLMARFDILNSYRQSIKNLFKNIQSKPHEFIALIPSFVESIILIATISEIDISGFKSLPKIKVILILYFITMFTWLNDESEYLEKTMTALDRYLAQIDKLIKIA